MGWQLCLERSRPTIFVLAYLCVRMGMISSCIFRPILFWGSDQTLCLLGCWYATQYGLCEKFLVPLSLNKRITCNHRSCQKPCFIDHSHHIKKTHPDKIILLVNLLSTKHERNPVGTVRMPTSFVSGYIQPMLVELREKPMVLKFPIPRRKTTRLSLMPDYL